MGYKTTILKILCLSVFIYVAGFFIIRSAFVVQVSKANGHTWKEKNLLSAIYYKADGVISNTSAPPEENKKSTMFYKRSTNITSSLVRDYITSTASQPIASNRSFLLKSEIRSAHVAEKLSTNSNAILYQHIPRNQQKKSRPNLLDKSRTNAVHSVNKSCSNDKRCTSLLSKYESTHYKLCQNRAFAMTGVDPDDIPYTCSFRRSRGVDPVGLISIPGSGNTWVRGLLEKATGICTGSIYCDIPLRNSGFVGESVRDGSVLVVKSHTSDYQWKRETVEVRNFEDALYGSAILLIRDPFDTLVAERHRTKVLDQHLRDDDSHVGKVTESEFGTNEEWSAWVYDNAERWKKTVLKWFGSAHKFSIPLLVVRYEDLKEDQVEQVARMLDFLQQDYNKTELAARLEVGFEKFHRQHTDQDDYDHFTEDQRSFIKSVITSAVESLKLQGSTELLWLYEYL